MYDVVAEEKRGNRALLQQFKNYNGIDSRKRLNISNTQKSVSMSFTNSSNFTELFTNSTNSLDFNGTLNTNSTDVRQFTHPIFSRAALIGICMFWLLMLVGPCVVASIENKRRLTRNEKLYKLENNTMR